MGHTAIPEVQFSDYIFPAFDQVCQALSSVVLVYSIGVLACQRGRKVALSFWRTIQLWGFNSTLTMHGSWPRGSVSLSKSRRFLPRGPWAKGALPWSIPPRS